tara:strand:- start:103 stop:249 length:147 start_codon:yes stop_codon:yes gene_type:complete
MKATLKFFLPQGGTWVLTREFDDERHMHNYIAYMWRNRRYVLDEIWKT